MTNPQDIVKAAIQAFRDQDAQKLESYIAHDIEWIHPEGHAVPGTFHGLDEVFEKPLNLFFVYWLEFDAHVEEMYTSDNHVFVKGTYKGLSIETGLPFKASFLSMYTLGNDKIVRYQQFTDTFKMQKALTP